jgi:hypothetical protein
MIDLGSQAGKPDPRILFLIRELDHMPAVTASTNTTTSAIFKSWFGPAKTIPAAMILLSIALPSSHASLNLYVVKPVDATQALNLSAGPKVLASCHGNERHRAFPE